MKNLKYLFLTLLSAFAFVACTEDTREADWSGIQGNGVYFAMDSQTSYMLEENQSSLQIPVERTYSEGDLTVNVSLEDETGIFAADSKARFKNGEKVGKVEIVFNFSQIEAGVAYAMTLSILDKNQLSGYGISDLTFTVKYDPWTYVGKGYFRDDIISSVFNIATPYAQTECDVYKSDAQEGLYRLGNVYNNPEFTAPMFGADPTQFTNNVREGYIVFDASNPNRVIIKTSDIGLIVNSSYGWMQIASDCDENNIPDAYNLYGTLENGIITFPKDAIVLILPLYNGGSILSTNASEKTRIVMPGGVATDPVVKVAYEGVMIDPNSNASAIFDVTMNEDAGSVLFAAVDAAADLNAALAGMMDGSVAVEEITENGEFAYSINEPGEYVGIFLPLSADGTVYGSPVSVPFEYSTGGLTPSQFAVEFEVVADETFATINITPNSEKFEYYWDFVSKADYEAILAQFGSIEAYGLAFFQYVAQSNGVSMADVMAAYASKGVVENEVVEGLQPGTDYIAYAFCVNMTTGEARSQATLYEFSTLETPELDADFANLLGTWTITSESSEVAKAPMQFDVTIESLKSNVAYNIYGWAGNAQVAKYPIMGYYQAADAENDALFFIPEQMTSTKLNTQYGGTYLCLFARYATGVDKTPYSFYGGEGPALVGGLSSATAGTIQPWYAKETDEESGQEVTYNFTGADFVLLLYEGDYKGQALIMSEDYAVGPFTMQKKATTQSVEVKNIFETEMSDIREAHLNQVNGKLARRNFLAQRNSVMVR